MTPRRVKMRRALGKSEQSFIHKGDVRQRRRQGLHARGAEPPRKRLGLSPWVTGHYGRQGDFSGGSCCSNRLPSRAAMST